MALLEEGADGRASRENGKLLLEVVEVGDTASLEQHRMVELEVVEVGGKASLEDEDDRLERVCDGEVHWRRDHYHYQILRILQFLPEISGVMVSLLVMVDSGVVGGPMASLHHLMTDLPSL